MSFICLSLTGRTLQENIEDVRRYTSHIDLIELRADFLFTEEIPHIHRFPALVPHPVLLTIRRKQDGGKYIASEKERSSFFSIAMRGAFDYVDFETDFEHTLLTEIVREKKIRIIRSVHDFDGVPEHPLQTIRSIPKTKQEIPKLAVMTNSSSELYRLVEACLSVRNEEKIVLGMGAYGFPTRVLAPRLGNYLTFCSPAGKSAAPGHIDPQQLDAVYRLRSQTGSTAVYGVIGNPVLHSQSPFIHNTGYEKASIDAVYVPFQVDELIWFFKMAELLDVQGLSVTVPYKENVIQWLDDSAETVTVTGACNTMARSDKGWYGYNFDVEGFLHPLETVVDRQWLQGKKVAVIGAGGAAKSVVFALTKRGADVCIFNRTVEKAERLAKRFSCAFAPLTDTERLKEYSDMLVQTTTVGMAMGSSPTGSHPVGDTPTGQHSPGTYPEGLNPIEDYTFQGHEIAYDLIYTPEKTPFLQKAEHAGCRIINGTSMLLEQAKQQFLIFTGVHYPES